jgi:AraC-like DNA-binding protein
MSEKYGVTDRLPPTSLPHDLLSEVVLPWALSNRLRLLLALPPFRTQGGIEIVPHQMPLLPAMRFRRSRHSGTPAAHWPDSAVNAVRHLCMICVLEGQADLRIGVTERMALAHPAIDPDIGCYTLRLPARSLLVIPPGVPYSDSSRGHWEGSQPDAAFSRLLWILHLPHGVQTHTCQTDGAKHLSGGGQIIRDGTLAPFTEALLGELSTPAPNTSEVAHHLIAALLLRITRSRHTSTENFTRFHSSLPPDSLPALAENRTVDKVVERACQYIRQNLTAPLTVERIAAGAYVSPSHLNRLFRAELQSSVMAFVERERIEAAKDLLGETDLSIRAISNHIGYTHPNYFSQVFTRVTGISPLKFRRKASDTSSHHEQHQDN